MFAKCYEKRSKGSRVASLSPSSLSRSFFRRRLGTSLKSLAKRIYMQTVCHATMDRFSWSSLCRLTQSRVSLPVMSIFDRRPISVSRLQLRSGSRVRVNVSVCVSTPRDAGRRQTRSSAECVSDFLINWENGGEQAECRGRAGRSEGGSENGRRDETRRKDAGAAAAAGVGRRERASFSRLRSPCALALCSRSVRATAAGGR